MSEIQRYDIVPIPFGIDGETKEMQLSDHGDYVLFTDHQAAIAELKSQLQKRPWSDEHTKNVIEGQVKEIDRLFKVIDERFPCERKNLSKKLLK